MIDKSKISLAAIAGALIVGVASPAMAHTGVGPAGGFAGGLGHPLGGIDHLLAMVAVGIWAAYLGGRALWLVPASFVAAMIVGGVLGHAGGAWAPVEIGIALSVVLLGIAVAAKLRMAAPLAMTVVAAFGLMHGHAHGAEAATSFASYATGFVLATGLLHATGILIGRIGSHVWAPRVAGAAIASAGVLLLI